MISERKWAGIRRRMGTLGIREADIEEKFVRSSGRGGQRVNKASTCAMIHHRPSGIRVKCQISRSQGENRFYARRILCDRLEERIRGAFSAAARKRHKIRTQKRKRSRRAKEKMLRLKKQRTQLKQQRKAPSFED